MFPHKFLHFNKYTTVNIIPTCLQFYLKFLTIQSVTLFICEERRENAWTHRFTRDGFYSKFIFEATVDCWQSQEAHIIKGNFLDLLEFEHLYVIDNVITTYHVINIHLHIHSFHVLVKYSAHDINIVDRIQQSAFKLRQQELHAYMYNCKISVKLEGKGIQICTRNTKYKSSSQKLEEFGIPIMHVCTCVRDCDVRLSLWVIRLKEDQAKQFKPTQIRCDSNRCSDATGNSAVCCIYRLRSKKN